MKDVLEKTIKSLSKKELINYKMYANRSNKTDDRKDISLFDAIKNHKKTDIEFISKSDNGDTYRKLKSRLLDNIGNSLLQFYYHETPTSYIYDELNLAHVFINKHELAIAHFHLNRAERMANKIQDFRLLDTIYNELIKLAVFYGEVSTYDYIEKRKINAVNLKNMQLFDDAVSMISYELHRNQALAKTSSSKIDDLNIIISELCKNPAFKNNAMFKLKLFDAISSVMIAKQQFEILENYCLKTFEEFTQKKYFTKDTHECKLKIIRFICSSLCENKKHEKALAYLKTYYSAIREFNDLYYNKHVFFYYNSMANNYSVLNPNKAIEILNEAKTIDVIFNFHGHLLYVYWNLAGSYFDTRKYKEALKNIILLKELDAFEQLNNSLKIHILIFEIVLRIEEKQFEFSQKLISQLLKEYKVTINLPEHQLDLAFIMLLKKIIKSSNIILNKANTKLLLEFNNLKFINQNSNVFNYQPWLKDKMK